MSEPQWREITVKYENRCLNCKETISEGSKALWQKGAGLKHIECPEPEPKDESQFWADPEPHSFEELQGVKSCQKCGKPITGDAHITIDSKKVCSNCIQ